MDWLPDFDKSTGFQAFDTPRNKPGWTMWRSWKMMVFPGHNTMPMTFSIASLCAGWGGVKWHKNGQINMLLVDRLIRLIPMNWMNQTCFWPRPLYLALGWRHIRWSSCPKSWRRFEKIPPQKARGSCGCGVAWATVGAKLKRDDGRCRLVLGAFRWCSCWLIESEESLG